MKFYYSVLLLISGLVFSQETILPYRDGKQWGFATASGKVVLQPIYDKIDPLDYVNIYRVSKNKKDGIVKQGKEIITPVYNFSYLLDSRFLVGNNPINDDYSVGSSRKTVCNLRGEKVLDHQVMDLNFVDHQIIKGDNLYVSWGATDNSGVFLYDDKLQKIKTWILKDVKGLLEYCGFSKEKNEIYICQYQEKENVKYAIKYNAKLKKYQVTRLMDKLELPELTMDDGMGRDFPQIKNNYLARTFEYFVNQGEIKLERKDQRYKESQYKKETLSWNPGYDEVTLHKYVQGNGTELYQHDSSPYNRDEMEKIDSVFQYRNYVTFKKDGKLGLLAENKLIEPKFQTIKYFSIGRSKPYFLVSVLDATSNLKYGVINSEGKTILPIVYDEIQYNSAGGYSKLWIIKSGNKYGVASSDGKVLKTPQYDLVEPNQLYYSVNLIKDKKYGFYSINDDFCEPVLPNKAVFVMTFNKQKFLKIVDDKENFLGYADFTGRVYFKN